MAMKGLRLLFFSLALVVFPALALGGETPNVVLTLTVQKEIAVKDEDGKTRLEWREVESTDPGDILRYLVTYHNKGSKEAKSVVIDNPVPPGTTYVAGSSEGKDSEITFSIDGKSFQVPPKLIYKAKKPDGTEEELSATPDMYTHIRWKLTKLIPPDASGTVSYKVKVK